MVKIELDINGISFYVSTVWKTDAVPGVGDIVIVCLLYTSPSPRDCS